MKVCSCGFTTRVNTSLLLSAVLAWLWPALLRWLSYLFCVALIFVLSADVPLMYIYPTRSASQTFYFADANFMRLGVIRWQVWYCFCVLSCLLMLQSVRNLASVSSPGSNCSVALWRKSGTIVVTIRIFANYVKSGLKTRIIYLKKF